MPRIIFPPVELADEHGLLAIGGNLEPETLIEAYSQGIFPWPVFGEGQLTWFSPPKRAVIFLDEFRVPRRLKRSLKNRNFTLRVNTAFPEVIRCCAAMENRGEQKGTWITEEVLRAYTELHHRGFCHSVECWLEGELVGGLYGVALGGMFAGESMFYRESDASKFCLIGLVEYLKTANVPLLDCQQKTSLLSQFGCREIPRGEFLDILSSEVARDICLFSEISGSP